MKILILFSALTLLLLYSCNRVCDCDLSPCSDVYPGIIQTVGAFNGATLTKQNKEYHITTSGGNFTDPGISFLLNENLPQFGKYTFSFTLSGESQYGENKGLVSLIQVDSTNKNIRIEKLIPTTSDDPNAKASYMDKSFEVQLSSGINRLNFQIVGTGQLLDLVIKNIKIIRCE